MSGIVGLNHLGLLVEDLEKNLGTYVEQYGFTVVTAYDGPDGERRALLVQGDAVLALLQPSDGSADAEVLRDHGDCVIDVGLRCEDPKQTHADLLERGAAAAAGELSVQAFGNVRHTLAPHRAGCVLIPGFGETNLGAGNLGLLDIDHLAVCLPAGTLSLTTERYHDIFGFGVVFEERIVVGDQGMVSQVVQDESGTVTLTMIEPDSHVEPGQIDSFLRQHGGAGVQHVAFRVTDAVEVVDEMRRRGVEFLTTVDRYYDQLDKRIQLNHHSIAELRRTHLLLDEDEHGQLFQIFTRSTHPRSTLFFEIIERGGAQTFGSNNIKALYAAVQSEMRVGLEVDL